MKWLPAVLMMLIIFLFSSRASYELPHFDWADRLVKKGAHMLGYAFLALTYWRAFNFQRQKLWLAWSLAVLYAMTDEWHQSFVPGRTPSVWDVLVFDNLGALIALSLAGIYEKRKRPGLVHLAVDE